MVLPTDDCDECTPPYLDRRSQASSAAAVVVFSALPFLVTFLLVAAVVFRRLFPFLSGGLTTKDHPHVSLSSFDLRAVPSAAARAGPGAADPVRRVAAFTFSATIALAAVLAELVLCEISDTVDPVSRRVALRLTVALLLLFLMVIIPSIEIYSVLSSAGWKYTGKRAGRLRPAWMLHGAMFLAWILGFWWAGHAMLERHRRGNDVHDHGGFLNVATEHVGVIGISVMALLSGFACIGSPWQSFVARPRPVSATGLARRQAGLDSTNEMLAAKRSRLRALELKASASGPEGFLQRAMGGLRGSADAAERRTLEMEIAGLGNMALSLSAAHSILSARLSRQRRSRTALGRAQRVAEYLFSVYCIYRLAATSLTFARRHLAAPGEPFRGSDPINNILALLVRHYDRHLDREAWTRQISFLLSGAMLLASFNSVLQTVHLSARFAPSLLRAAQANLALIVAQVCATYVISVAILLQGIMPGQAAGERLNGLGGGDLLWVDAWFEGWFLAGALATGLGVWVGRKVLGGGAAGAGLASAADGRDEFEDDDGYDDGYDDDVEMGKRS